MLDISVRKMTLKYTIVKLLLQHSGVHKLTHWGNVQVRLQEASGILIDIFKGKLCGIFVIENDVYVYSFSPICYNSMYCFRWWPCPLCSDRQGTGSLYTMHALWEWWNLNQKPWNLLLPVWVFRRVLWTSRYGVNLVWVELFGGDTQRSVLISMA